MSRLLPGLAFAILPAAASAQSVPAAEPCVSVVVNGASVVDYDCLNARLKALVMATARAPSEPAMPGAFATGPSVGSYNRAATSQTLASRAARATGTPVFRSGLPVRP